MLEQQGVRVDVVRGQAELARCREILLDRTPRATVDVPLPKTSHHFVHLGSGLPISRGPLERVGRGSKAFKDLTADYRRDQNS